MARVIINRTFKITIYQCHSKHFGLTSRLIEFHQKTNYSHMAIGFTSETGREMIIDSTRKNISFYPADNYFSDKYDAMGTKEIELDCSRKEFLSVVEDWLGLDYPESQIIGLMLNIVINRNGSKKMTCNELALRIPLRLKKGFKFDGDLDAVDLNEAWKALNE